MQTIPSMAVNRCKLTGRGGGRIANEFGLCRVRALDPLLSWDPFQLDSRAHKSG